ncbi:MAG: cysteine desulfurase NifS [Kiritimatiellia bacterium]
MRTIYLDNNATTRPDPAVLDAMMPFLTEQWGNPSSMHTFGGNVRRHVEAAREQVAALLGADPVEIVFTSGGTESDNMAIRGAAEALSPRPFLVTSRVEHPAVLEPCRHLRDQGYELTEIGVDAVGALKLDELRETLERGPAVVSLMWANNETGALFPIETVAGLVKAAGGILHTDAVQAVGKVPIDLRHTPVDLLSLSGHKLHAPKGVGALYVRRGTRLKPLLLGGHQEHNRRSGTENVPGIVALGKACELMRQGMAVETRRMAALRDRLEQGLLATCADSRVNGDRRQRMPNTVNISFEFIEGESILYHLSDLGVAASSGSACSSGSLEPSHVLRAMGIPFTAVHGSIRFSLSRFTTGEDVDYVLAKLPDIVKKLRAMSPFVKK